jgi:phosphate transport system substrate-binding protein
MTGAELARIARGPDASGWDPFEAMLLRAADELHVSAFVSDSTWNALSARYDVNQRVDLVDAVGVFTLHAGAINSLGVEIKAAKDALSIYVHESNPVKELSLAKIKGIYTGKITNWKDLGGPDARIIMYGRENNSGTYVYFKEFVLENEDYSSSMQSMPGTAAVVNAVAKDKFGVGYGGAAYGKGIEFVNVKTDESSKAYAPNADNVKAGVYPITRYLYMYTRSRPAGAIKEFIDWTLSAEGQEIVKKVEYFPVK